MIEVPQTNWAVVLELVSFVYGVLGPTFRKVINTENFSLWIFRLYSYLVSGFEFFYQIVFSNLSHNLLLFVKLLLNHESVSILPQNHLRVPIRIGFLLSRLRSVIKIICRTFIAGVVNLIRLISALPS